MLYWGREPAAQGDNYTQPYPQRGTLPLWRGRQYAIVHIHPLAPAPTKRFLQKIDARWAERSPGKRGLVGWIGDEETSSGCLDSEAENTHTTQKLWSFR